MKNQFHNIPVSKDPDVVARFSKVLTQIRDIPGVTILQPDKKWKWCAIIQVPTVKKGPGPKVVLRHLLSRVGLRLLHCIFCDDFDPYDGDWRIRSGGLCVVRSKQ